MRQKFLEIKFLRYMWEILEELSGYLIQFFSTPMKKKCTYGFSLLSMLKLVGSLVMSGEILNLNL